MGPLASTVSCEMQDDHYHECGKPAAGLCLDWSMHMCREHLSVCQAHLHHTLAYPPAEAALVDGEGI